MSLSLVLVYVEDRATFFYLTGTKKVGRTQIVSEKSEVFVRMSERKNARKG